MGLAQGGRREALCRGHRHQRRRRLDRPRSACPRPLDCPALRWLGGLFAGVARNGGRRASADHAGHVGNRNDGRAARHMSGVLDAKGVAFEAEVPVLIIGAGAAGLCAALAANEAGVEAIVVERDKAPRGSTALSAGLIPAAGTRFQRESGIVDSPGLFAEDIQRKAGGAADPEGVRTAAENAGPTVEWLADRHGFAFSVIDDFDYPGHRSRRMHGLPSRSGAELIGRLAAAVESAGVLILTEATATTLFVEADRSVRGIEVVRPDGSSERIGCGALVLACSGYGGNRELVRRHIPEM